MSIPLDPMAAARRAASERTIGRLLIALTYVAVAVLVVGVLGMIAAGISPLDAAPTVDLGSIVDAARGLEPVGVLWLGLIIVIVTPILRVAAAAISFGRGGEWRMVGISLAILLVIAIGVVTALATET